MRAVLLIATASAGVAFPAVRAGAQTPPAVHLLVALPEAEARAFLGRHTSAAALVVFPPSRSPAEVLVELGRGMPVAREPSTSTDPGGPAYVRTLLGGVDVVTAVAPSALGSDRATLASVLSDRPSSTTLAALTPGDRTRLAVVVLGSAEDLDPLLARVSAGRVLVLGIGERTPALFAVAGTAPGRPNAVLRGGITRRPGIVTPYDVAATILREVSAPPGEVIGRALTPDASADPFAELAAIAERMDRDVGVARPATVATALGGVAALLLASGALALKMHRLAAALARAAAMAPAGYLAGIMLPLGTPDVRVAPVVAAMLFGFTFPVRDVRRFAGWAFLVPAVAIALLTVLAAARPDAEPALSLWDDPLVSWRFFGLRNHLTAFVTGGAVAGLALLRVPAPLALAGVAGAAVLFGAATLGANFLAVLTLVLGGLLAVLMLASKGPRAWHPPLAGSMAVLGLAVALNADASAGSHGGRAAEAIRSGGLSQAWTMLVDRARLNNGEIAAIGPAGYVALVVMASILAALFWWALRGAGRDYAARAAVAGMSAAALAAIVVEDTGFFVGGILGMFAWVAFLGDAVARWYAGPAP